MKKIHKFLMTGDRILAFDENDEHIPQVSFDLADWATWCVALGYDPTGAVGEPLNLSDRLVATIIRTSDNGFNFSYNKQQ
jgi:hypothetical protein